MAMPETPPSQPGQYGWRQPLSHLFHAPLGPGSHLGLLLLLAIIAAAGSLALGADANWDLRNYHLYNPWALLEGRWEQDMGWNVQWFLNPIPQLPYYALVSLWPDNLVPVTALMGIPGALVAWAMLLLYRELGRLFSVPAWLLGIAWIASCTGAVTIGQLGTTFNDLAVTFIVLLGCLCVLRGLREGDDRWWPALGFFAFGAAMGLKITFALFVLGPALAWFFTRPRFSALWPGALASVLGLLLVGGWWFALLQLRYDSPLFPFFNSFFESPWWAPISERDPRFDPQGLMQWLFYPFYWWRANVTVSEVPFADGRISLGLLAAIAALLGSGVALFALLIVTTQPPNWGRVPASQPSLIQITSPIDTENALVAVAQGDPPLNYLAVGLPGPSHFISVNPLLNADTLTGERARQFLASAEQRYWVTPAPAEANGPHGWAACFGLQLQVDDCQPLQANDPGVPALEICPLRAHPNPPPQAEVCQ